MKNLLSLLFIITAFSASAQVPNWVPAEPDSVKIGVLRNGVVNQVKMGDLMRNRVSTTKYTTDSLRNEAVYFHYKEGLISGGIVTLNTGMTLDVTAAIYSINNAIHYSTAGQITLNAADPSLPRVDVIAVNNLYQIVKITGTPSVNPIEPQLDPLTQVKLTSLYIAAGATSPAITQNIIYDENTEWTVTTGGTITANANSTLRAIHGTKSVLISSFSSGSYVKFKTASSPINVTDLSSLKFYFYLQSAWANSNNLSIQFFRNNVSVSNAPIIGVNKSAIGTWQTLAQAAFNFTGTSFDEVRFIFSGSSSTQVSLDYIQAQGGIGGNPNTAAEIDPFYSANGATKAALNDTAAALRSAILSGGTSSGTVTSVAKGFGTVQGAAITTTGTIAVDSAAIATTGRINKVKDSLQANITNITTTNNTVLATKADKATTISINGVTHDLSTNSTYTVSGVDSGAYRTITAINDSTVSFNRTDGTKDTLVIGGTGGSGSSSSITGGIINWPGAIYNTPTTASVASNNLTFAPSLANQSAKTFFGRNTGTGVPSFLANTVLDSTWIAALHTQAYYDARYAAIGSTGGGSSSGWGLPGNAVTAGSDFLGTTNNVSLRMRTNNIERLVVDTLGNVFINQVVSATSAKLNVTGGMSLVGNMSLNGALTVSNVYGVNYLISPFLYGGFSANNTLTLSGNSSGSGNTATSPAIYIKTGNNITTTALTVLNNGTLQFNSVVEYTDNAAAMAAGLTNGAVYRTGDLLKIVH